MNLPNKLTMLRVILVPVFMVFAACSRYGTADFNPAFALVAGIIFAAALANPTDIMAGGLITQLRCWLCGAATLLSGGIYLWQNRKLFMQAK